ncbi:hypothetical protein [Streptomyces sp. SID14515]|uniref:hypothetical protein n=1 Tax=Streptomyces sp. SID14515 TaxID=2706074 RepID=UPI0013CAFA9C|nr:hypothetical protein [Streptomyces sp. SID14515]NEB40772.1 hypothetical protein [Streptomyces sp. SID14515]
MTEVTEVTKATEAAEVKEAAEAAGRGRACRARYETASPPGHPAFSPLMVELAPPRGLHLAAMCRAGAAG